MLYTAPQAPYLSNHRLYLPLRAVSQLLGGNAAYDPATKAAKIQLNNHTVEINAATKETFYDGSKAEGAAVPQMVQQTLYVPIQVLIDGLKVEGSWDPNRQLFTVTDPSLSKTPLYINIRDFDATEVYNEDAFYPLSFTYERKKDKKDVYHLTLTVTARNITGADIPENDEYLHPLYLFSSGAFSYDRKEDTAAVKKDEVITRTWTRRGLESYQYILFVGITGADRTIDLP